MTKVRRQKKRKTFQYQVNRKRLNKKRTPAAAGVLKNEWNVFSSTQKNFKKNGLVYDVNKDIKCMSRRDKGKKPEEVRVNTRIISQLEEAANAVEKKQSNMSKDQMDYLGYLVNKYGEDYQGMAKDRRNYLQHTWKQLRHQIKTYKIVLERHKRIAKKAR